MFIKPRRIWKETPNIRYITIMPNLLPDAIMNHFKWNCTKLIRRTEKCICKKTKLWCTTLFACLLDNDHVCENQETDDQRIVHTSDVEDHINTSVEFGHCIETSFLIFSVNWRASLFLYTGNFGLKLVFWNFWND